MGGKISIFKSFLAVLALISSQSVWAASSEGGISLVTGSAESALDWVRAHFRISYHSFLNGPGLAPGERNVSPNYMGRPSDDGLSVTNRISIRYRLTQRWDLDWQNRVQLVLNNANDVAGFSSLRWQSPQVGVSGKIASGRTWALTGAINTDLPYVFPQPIGGGYSAERRTLLLSPGMFASLTYREPGSRWSLYSLVTPRYFIYGDRNAAEPQMSRAGLSPGMKPELALNFSPSVNYALSPRAGLRFGTGIRYSKAVMSSWNPFNAVARKSAAAPSAWLISPIPLQFGGTYEFSREVNVSSYIQAYPISGQRIDPTGKQISMWSTASVGMQVSGMIM